MYRVRFQHDRPSRNRVSCVVRHEDGRHVLTMQRPTIEHLRSDMLRTLGVLGVRLHELVEDYSTTPEKETR